MRALFVGQGAVGSLLAARCKQRSSAQVSVMVRRSEQQDRIKRDGIRIGEETVRVHDVLMTGEPVANMDTLFVCVKSNDVVSVLNMLEKTLETTTTVIPIHNGIVDYPAFTHLHVFPAITYAASTQNEEGVVMDHGNTTATTIVAETTDAAALKHLGLLRTALGWSDLIIASDRTPLWSKLAVNCGINALAAVAHCTNGDLLQNLIAMDLSRQAVNETVEAAAICDVRLDADQIWETTTRTMKATAHNTNSLLRDCLRGRPTEIDSLNGMVAATLQRPNTVNQSLFHLIHAVSLGHH